MPTAPPPPTYLLAGDIGGTNSRLALYRLPPASSPASPPTLHHPPPSSATAWCEYLNEKFTDFDGVLRAFLSFGFPGGRDGYRVVASLACAGPVADNAVDFTNANGKKFSVCGRAVCAPGRPYPGGAHFASCVVVNDFVGLGYGTLTLDNSSGEVERLDGDREVVEGGVICCVGAGTGLGECFLTCDAGGAYTCHPSEGGHKDYAARNATEAGLKNYIVGKYDPAGNRCSIERVASGTGIVDVYEYLAGEDPQEVDPTIDQAIKAAGSLQGKVIGTAAKENACALCVKTMDIFAGAYGAEVGNAAVQYLPRGGLYVCGGLTPKNMHLLRGDGSPFLRAYRDKGRLSGLVGEMPVYAVTVEDLGLRGARYLALREYLRIQEEEEGEPDAPERRNADFGYPSLLVAGAAFAAVALLKGRKK